MFRGMNILQENRNNGILAKHLFLVSHLVMKFSPCRPAIDVLLFSKGLLL